MSTVVALALAVVLMTVWGIAATARRSRHDNDLIKSDATEEVLIHFVVSSLDMVSAPEVLAAAGVTASHAFAAERVVVFEPGAEEGAWDAWTPALRDGEEQGASQPVPENLRAVFGWLRHNPQVVPLHELAGPRFGAMRLPLGDLKNRFGVDVLLPLVDRTQALAAVGFSMPRAPVARELDLMEHLRIEAAAAVANIRLHREAAHKLTLEKEMDLASAVEIALVPEERSGERHGLSWAGEHQVAGQAGSDFWSVYPLGDGRVMFVIGDVVGGGLAGSMASAMAKSCCDSLNADLATLDSGALLSALNRALHRPGRSLHMTCFSGIFDAKTLTLEYSNAGHPMPYRLAPDGSLRVLGRGGPMLGDSPATLYRPRRERLVAGEALVLYTDGIVETLDPRRMPFGEGRFQRLLRKHAKIAGRDLVRAVWDEVERFRDTAPRVDDLALVVVRVG